MYWPLTTKPHFRCHSRIRDRALGSSSCSSLYFNASSTFFEGLRFHPHIFFGYFSFFRGVVILPSFHHLERFSNQPGLVPSSLLFGLALLSAAWFYPFYRGSLRTCFVLFFVYLLSSDLVCFALSKREHRVIFYPFLTLPCRFLRDRCPTA